MRRLLLGVVSAALSFGALAQVQAPEQLPSRPSYTVVSVVPGALVVASLPASRAQELRVGLESVRFLKESQDFETDPLDVVVTYGEYNCARPGQWRALLERGFSRSNEAHVFREAVVSPWKTAKPGSAEDALWTAACKPSAATGPAYSGFDTAAGRDRVLDAYRQSGRAP